MPSPHFETFEDFWPFYVSEHMDPTNRKLHFVGTTLFFGCVALGVLHSRKWFLLMPLLGYGPAWIGHFFFEGNKPASFEHPVWSFLGDMRMYKCMLTGKMDEELLRAAAWVAAQR